MDTNRISIIIPIFNSQEFLARCVESVLRQTHKNIEIILVNDGSTDNSGAICDDYTKKDARITVIHQKNAGKGAARSSGVGAATGQWLGFVDSDDYIEETMFEELLKAAVAADKKLAVCGFSKLFQNGRVVDRTCPEIPAQLTGEEALPYLLSGRYFGGFMWNKLFSRAIFDSHKLDTELNYMQDLPFVLQVFLKIDGLTYVPSALYNYNMHDGNSSQTFKAGRLDELTARKRIIELAAPVSMRLEVLAKAWYSVTATGLIYLVALEGTRPEKKELLPMLREEALKYKAEYFKSDDFSLPQRVFHILSFFSPALCRMLKRILKR